MSSSIKVDQISFLTGGYGAVGVAMYTYHVYKGVPLPSSPPPDPMHEHPNTETEGWQAQLKKYTRFALSLGLVQLRAVERFFIGGCLYITIEKGLITRGITNEIFNAAVAGSIVGFYECGYHERYETLINSVAGVAGFAVLEEAIILIGQKWLQLRRPISVITLDYDPLFYIVGALGAYYVGLHTRTFFENMYFPQLPQHNNDSWTVFLQKWLKFTSTSLSNGARIKVRIEERAFLGGCMSWAIQHLLQKIGIHNRLLRVSVTGGIVGGYFGTYGPVIGDQIARNAIGVIAFGIFTELFVAPILTREQLWEFMVPFPDPESPN